ncbi:hypothetical protein [Romboutsia sp. 1001713B170131_170501_G6]|uniref:hypothetical protein n=1 Tax=Romboutsia sp. 1001713B170131_170501_G6 TaxID=2787108 RepID=UPI0018AB0F8A|nr:hypothetical protein [Romboutsia sp. 1001713B170131_170501_G6]
MGKYKLDYFAKYYFFEKEDFLKEEEGEYILNRIKESNRFDYKGYSYKYTKYNNISKGHTQKNVEVEIPNESIDIILNGDRVHLDLIYKFYTKKLEDHIRITTRMSEKTEEVSCLLYIDYIQANDFIKELENIKKLQEYNMKS